eukprot:CAMPEP_0204904944 /NCGR_PEP_ID=MMETSP1397-20131031/5154_1 /ASSEMBLY_ACC=CAM_ASM_000891 /TAXON_ID=49980 /ORGANISM="Climacostomum Climacostomum virens, Strain Stock W-24" /LENGTH=360 /DNA_ID=CAMNT_0052073787 /DNA_START=138 /DNA_END=1217 /DNA_ORIENTATION=-
MFGTPFEVLRRGEGTQQTTKGINVFATRELIILDVEGTDSQERNRSLGSQEERKDVAASTENKFALFALMATEVLIINVQAEAVGRQTSLCLNLLRRIFEVSLKYPQELVRKQVVFFLRDFLSEDFKEETLFNQIKSKIGEVWESIEKPREHKGRPLSNFCDLEFITFPHKKYCAEEFKAKAQTVSKRFTDSRSGNYMFKLSLEHICEPSDIPDLYRELWERIKNDENLEVIVGMLVSQYKAATVAISSKSQELAMVIKMLNKMMEQMAKQSAELEKSRQLVLEKERQLYKAQTELLTQKAESERAALHRQIEIANENANKAIQAKNKKQALKDQHQWALEAERVKQQQLEVSLARESSK